MKPQTKRFLVSTAVATSVTLAVALVILGVMCR
jgi:hypothetical protein